MSTSEIRCAVIGGGPQGLMAAKTLKDEGFDVTLFETRGWVGGLWKYDEDSGLSVAEITTFNTSKHRLAMSDFPVPDEDLMDDFPTGPQTHKYLEDYCDHFGLRPHLRLNTRVTTIRRVHSEWVLEYHTRGDKPSSATFDKVVVACGTFNEPKRPHFEGKEQFAGKQLHTIEYHHPEQFRDQNVVVVGIHHSAQDVLCSSHASGAKKVFLTHRRGLTLLSRYGADGLVYDASMPLWFFILSQYIAAFFPTFMEWAFDKLLQGLSKKSFPNIKDSWAFSPAPSLTVATPVINTQFYDLLQQGYCEPVSDIKRITGPKSIELRNGRTLEDIDAIVYATGYNTTIPVAMDPPELNPRKKSSGPAELYHGVFPMHRDTNIRNSLAFLCQAAVPFPGYSQFEMQAVVISMVWSGKRSLPARPQMVKWYQNLLKQRAAIVKRHNITDEAFFSWYLPVPDQLAWLDDMAGLGIRKRFGILGRWVNWEAWKLWWTDRELYHLCLNGLTTPAILRLFDEGGRKPWAGAREQIFIDNARVEAQKNRKFAEMQKVEQEKKGS